MNCVRCNAPLEPGVRFCGNCGMPVSSVQNEYTVSPEVPASPSPRFPQATQTPPFSAQAGSYQPNTFAASTTVPPAPYAASTTRHRRRSGCRGCAIGCLSTLLILALLGVAAWVFGIRPYLHNLAVTQLNSALSAAVNQLPASASQLPAGSVVVSQNTLNNLLVLNLPPSNPVQQPNMQITPAGMRLDFQIYGQPCSITAVPTARNGKLVVTNTAMHGILSAVLSPNDITTLLNKHLADALGRINHTVQGVSLKNHEMDVTLN